MAIYRVTYKVTSEAFIELDREPLSYSDHQMQEFVMDAECENNDILLEIEIVSIDRAEE